MAILTWSYKVQEDVERHDCSSPKGMEHKEEEILQLWIILFLLTNVLSGPGVIMTHKYVVTKYNFYSPN